GNPNVSVAAAQFFAQHPQLADVERLRQQIVAHPVSAVRGLLLAAALQQTADQQPLLDEFEKTFGHSAPEDLVPMIEALVWAPASAPLLDSLVLSSVAEISTAAFTAQLKLFENSDRSC